MKKDISDILKQKDKQSLILSVFLHGYFMLYDRVVLSQPQLLSHLLASYTVSHHRHTPSHISLVGLLVYNSDFIKHIAKFKG